jgi:glycosyltransferase involved in cell wall biosynthesis
VANVLLNFQASYSGGGLKRLIEFSKYFNGKDGATFLIHPNAFEYCKKFTYNKYFVIKPSLYDRILNHNAEGAKELCGSKHWDVYYSYGVPVEKSVTADKVIVHVSNVLPFVLARCGYGVLDWLKFRLIYFYMKKSFRYCTHVAAESEYSLRLLKGLHSCVEIYSQNGSDDEINNFGLNDLVKSRIAVIVGTHLHKNLADGLIVFDSLKLAEPDAKLYVVGDVKNVPANFSNRSDVILLGSQDRNSVVELLKSAYYYISTTVIENSFNAASEGVYLAARSYISDIQPHRELLSGLNFASVTIPNCQTKLLKVDRLDLTTRNLKSWSIVANDLFEN